jgi:hypothetical protein
MQPTVTAPSPGSSPGEGSVAQLRRAIAAATPLKSDFLKLTPDLLKCGTAIHQLARSHGASVCLPPQLLPPLW